ncbi:carbonic anhydrase [Carboxylicivirga taeanensis]|uniref:carbonic anhydrase n=1 Tax=Carboxylicivirga taeanensis TaxID=1416875 RepID=UPI003F6DFBD6
MKPRDKVFIANKAWAQSIRDADEHYFKNLAIDQTPEYFWIGCADSRMSETLITSSQLGEFFVHRNVSNLVDEQDASLMAALSFAVNTLGVSHVVVAGHTYCGGVKAAYEGIEDAYVSRWIKDIRETLHDNQSEIDAIEDEAEKVNRLAELSIIKQVDKLLALDILKQAWARGQRLFVHGWLFDISTGELHALKEVHPDEMIP